MGDNALITGNGPLRSPVGSSVARNWSFYFLLISVAVFSFTGKNFFALNNFQNIIHLATTALLLGCAETFVIITGGIDLSVGSVLAFSAMTTGWFFAHQSMNFVPALICGLAAGCASGLVSGFLITHARLPPHRYAPRAPVLPGWCPIVRRQQ